MHEISALIGPPRRYHFIVWSLVFVRAFPSAWNTFAALFIASDVQHWCSEPNLSSVTHWTVQQRKTEALAAENISKLVTTFEHNSCVMFPIKSALVNSSDEPFSNSAPVLCKAWIYNESAPGSSVVPEVPMSFSLYF